LKSWVWQFPWTHAALRVCAWLEILWLQGFAVRIGHEDLTGSGLKQALSKVLGDSKYATAAAGISVKLRARKRTPVQEAVGTPPAGFQSLTVQGSKVDFAVTHRGTTIALF